MRNTCGALLLSLLAEAALAGDGWFVPGRVFLSVLEPEACHLPEANNWLVAVDPETGEAWDVADRVDGLCNNNGLRFTPDGSRLLILNLGRNEILGVDAAGEVTVAYDGEAGLGGPFGRNGLDFDDGGNLFVANEYWPRILRFPPGNAEASVFVDPGDGGALAYDGAGGFFFGIGTGTLLWITPDGIITTFDTLGPRAYADSVTVDRRGNVFVAGGGKLFRYDNADATTQRLLYSGFVTPGGDVAIAMSPDDAYVYVSDADSLWAVDALSGERRLIYDTPWPRSSGRGIAVYDPPRPGDVNCDRRVDNGDIDAFVLALTDPDAYAAQFSWCRRDLADVNGDTFIDAADIDPFVARLIGE